MRGAHGALHSTRWLRMLWGQNVGHAYTPPRPALAGLIAGLPLHRYYYDYNNNNNSNSNNTTKRTHTGRAVQDIQVVTQHAYQAHAATQHTPSPTHHTTSTCIGTTSCSSNSNDRKEEDVRCVERVCTSALLPSRAAEMTLCDASEGVPLLAVTPCDAADVQQTLCLLHRRAHTRSAQTHTTNTITASASTGERSVCDVAAAYDTLAALHTTVHTHRTLLAGAESLQTGVPLRFTQAALSAALQYMEQALHTLSTYTNNSNDDGSSSSSSSTQEACHAEAAPAVHARRNNNKRKQKKAGAGEEADRHNDSDTTTTRASIAAAAATAAATIRILQQDCQALREGLQHHLHPSSSHTSYPALCLTPTTFSLAYALQATAAALLTPGCGDVLWLPSADAALSALWLMHLLTHPAHSTRTSHSTHTSDSDDVVEVSAVRKAGVWGAAGRFHVLLTGSHSLHVLPGLTSFSYYTSSSSSSQLLSSQLVQSVREGDHVEGSGTEPARSDVSGSARSVAAHTQSDATHTTTTIGATAASSSSSSAMQPAAPHTPHVPLLLLYGLTPAAAQALYTELQRKMQQQQRRHEVHCAKSADDCPALPSSWSWLTLRPACPSFVVCHTARASTPCSAGHGTTHPVIAAAAAATGEDTPHVAHDGLVKTTRTTTAAAQDEDEEEKTVCAAMALWLYRHAFTPCHTMSGTPTTAATAETVKAEMHTGERAGDMAKASPEKEEGVEEDDVLCVHLSPLPALCGVSCVRLTKQTHTATADRDNNKEHTTTCSYTTLITPPSSSLLLRTSLAFIPQSQLRHVLREMVRLYGGSSASAAATAHVAHISHSLDMGAAIGPLRSAAHAEAVRRCIAAAVKGQPDNNEGEEKEEEERVRRTRAVAGTERQGRHSAPHTCNATSSAAASHGSSSSNSSYTTRKTTGSSNSSSDTSQHVQQQPQDEHGTDSYTSTTTCAVAVQPVRWQKVCGGFPLSMTAAGPAALYLTPCLLCTSLSSLITATPSPSSSSSSAHIHTHTTSSSSSCPLSTTARGSDDDIVDRAEADVMQRAVAEAVGRVCHSVHALTRELERDYDGTVPSVLFVCGYEESMGRWVQRACEQYAQQQQRV